MNDFSSYRVEPEISIVEEAPGYNSHTPIAPMPQQIAPKPQIINSRGRGRPPVGGRPVMSPAAQAAMRVKAQLRAQNHPQQQQWGTFKNNSM